MSTVQDAHWDTLEKFRQRVEGMFATEVLPFPEKLSEYDQIIAAGRDALEARGLDLSIPEQVYVVASTISWMSNVAAGLTVAKCGDPHVLVHLKEALQWPAFLVRELTLNVPLAEKTPEEGTDGPAS
jgi:hypothetical protein